MSAELTTLLSLLDSTDPTTTGTSLRLPVALRDAAAVAAAMGAGTSVTGLTNRALRTELLIFAQQRALDEHYLAYPAVKPSLAEVALARAEIDGSDLAERPDLIERAAAVIVRSMPAATPGDVLLFAAGMAAGPAA